MHRPRPLALLSALVSCAFAFAPPVASAEDGAPAPMEEEGAPAPQADALEPLPGVGATQEAEALFTTGRLQLSLGQVKEAEATFTLLCRLYGESPRCAEGRALLARRPAERAGPPPALGEDGQAELVASQTLFGILAGVTFPLVFETDTVRPSAIGALVGAGLGLGGSLAYSSQASVTVAEAQSLYWSQFYTALNINLLWGGVKGEVSNRTIALSTAGGVLLGLPVGYFLHQEVPRSRGQLSLISSSGIWGGYYGGLITANVMDRLNPKDGTGALIVAATTDVALGLAYGLAGKLPISRGRVRLINLGGTLGGLVAATGLVFFGDELEVPGITGLLGVSTGAGLLVGTLLTREWDPSHNPELFRSSSQAGIFAIEGGHLALGEPVPEAFVATFSDGDGRPVQHQGVGVKLLTARF